MTAPVHVVPLRSDGDDRAVGPVPMARDIMDAELVERAKTGDRWAEEMLYRRHAGFVTALCTRLLRHTLDAEDTVQDAFVDVLEQLETLREPGMFRRWLTGIAVHKAHRRLRRRRLLRWLGFRDPGQEEAIGNVVSHSISPELLSELERLDGVLRTLPSTDRIAWQLRYVEGYQLDEVAELCRCSRSTAQRRINRADTVVRSHVRLEESTDE
jgi:RNA polymerase sigma-70 factor (ECF subfamily)